MSKQIKLIVFFRTIEMEKKHQEELEKKKRDMEKQRRREEERQRRQNEIKMSIS